VVATTGAGYMTKRQEAMDAMAQILQGNPQLWTVAGDLFVKNMDWPGAQEMAKRLQKTIDPKLLADSDEDPALQAAQQQMQGMAQEMEQMHTMLQNVNKSMEMQEIERKNYEAQIKMFDAETKRIATVQASMSPDQIHDIVMGTIHAAIDTGDLISGSQNDQRMNMQEDTMQNQMPQGQPMQGEMPPEQQMMSPQGMPNETM
jgi:hypothetical protein